MSFARCFFLFLSTIQWCVEQICSPVCGVGWGECLEGCGVGGFSTLLMFSVSASFLPVIFHLQTSPKCVITIQLPGVNVNANMQPFLFPQEPRHTFYSQLPLGCFLFFYLFLFYFYFFCCFCSCLDGRSFSIIFPIIQQKKNSFR